MVATMAQGARVNHKIPPMNIALPVDLRACYGMDPELFVGPDVEGTEDKIFREQEAKDICRTCPLVIECLQWAQTHNEYGVWGGTNRDDRRRLRAGRPLRGSDGRTKQERRRAERVKLTLQLSQKGLTPEEIAAEIGVTKGTIYDYFRIGKASGHE